MDYGRLVLGAALVSVIGCGGATLPDDEAWIESGGTTGVGGLTWPVGAGGSWPSKGGAIGKGGAEARGGNTGKGGAVGTGGIPAKGGQTGKGGATGRGGNVWMGGTLNRGGTSYVNTNKGGGTAKGGSTNLGGAPYAGGASGVGGEVLFCAPTPITFVMVPSSPDRFCDGAGCTSDWLEIRTAAGEYVETSAGCMSTCSECVAIACDAACRQPQAVPSLGVTTTWDGTIYQRSACATATSGGVSQILKCVDPTCALSGQYIARMCGYINGASAGAACAPKDQHCVEVPFVYPGTTVVKGYLDLPLR